MDYAEHEMETMGAGPASPDAVMGAEQEVVDAQVANAVGQAPVPPDALEVNVLHELVSAVNDTLGALFPDGAMEVRWEAPPKVTAVKEALPQEVWMPLAALGKSLGSMAAMEGGEVVAEYVFDPATVATTEGIQDIVMKLGGLARDKKAQAFFRSVVVPPEGEPAEPPEATAEVTEEEPIPPKE